MLNVFVVNTTYFFFAAGLGFGVGGGVSSGSGIPSLSTVGINLLLSFFISAVSVIDAILLNIDTS